MGEVAASPAASIEKVDEQQDNELC